MSNLSIANDYRLGRARIGGSRPGASGRAQARDAPSRSRFACRGVPHAPDRVGPAALEAARGTLTQCDGIVQIPQIVDDVAGAFERDVHLRRESVGRTVRADSSPVSGVVDELNRLRCACGLACAVGAATITRAAGAAGAAAAIRTALPAGAGGNADTRPRSVACRVGSAGATGAAAAIRAALPAGARGSADTRPRSVARRSRSAGATGAAAAVRAALPAGARRRAGTHAGAVACRADGATTARSAAAIGTTLFSGTGSLAGCRAIHVVCPAAFRVRRGGANRLSGIVIGDAFRRGPFRAAVACCGRCRFCTVAPIALSPVRVVVASAGDQRRQRDECHCI